MKIIYLYKKLPSFSYLFYINSNENNGRKLKIILKNFRSLMNIIFTLAKLVTYTFFCRCQSWFKTGLNVDDERRMFHFRETSILKNFLAL